MVVPLAELLEETATALRDDVVTAVPRAISAVLLALLAYVGIRVVLSVLRRVLARMFSDGQELVVRLFVTVVGVFLWFGAALAVLKTLGMDEVATSLGTAVGFVALGVSYALSEMIGDTVAGIYLLRNPDFEGGDHCRDRASEEPLRPRERRHHGAGQPGRRVGVDETGRVVGDEGVGDGIVGDGAAARPRARII